MTHLTAKRVLILGAETEIGRAVTTAVAEAGASVAAVAATSDAEAAFAVQRLARRLSTGGRRVIAQAIDATNEAAVRVMVRQVSKDLRGLDAVVYCERPIPTVVSPHQIEADSFREVRVYSFLSDFAQKEFERSGKGKFVLVVPGVVRSRTDYVESTGPLKQRLPFELVGIGMQSKSPEAIASEVSAAIAGEAESG